MSSYATLNMQCIKNVFGRGCAVARNFAREGFDLPFPLLSAPAELQTHFDAFVLRLSKRISHLCAMHVTVRPRTPLGHLRPSDSYLVPSLPLAN